MNFQVQSETDVSGSCKWINMVDYFLALNIIYVFITVTCLVSFCQFFFPHACSANTLPLCQCAGSDAGFQFDDRCF